MTKRIAAISLCILWLAGLVISAHVSAQESSAVTVHLFWGDGCPHCSEAEVFLHGLTAKHGGALDVRQYEVWYHPENKKLLREMAESHGITVEAVPVIFVDERAWVGFNEAIGQEIAEVVGSAIAGVVTSSEHSGTSVQLPFHKETDLQGWSLLWATALIGFVDGMNPCSLWVLSLLLAMLLRSGSRQRIMAVGITFLAVTSVIYSLFVAGLFGVFSYVGYLRWIQVLVALIALGVGAVNVKEYFAFGRGPSLTISDDSKSRIYRGIRRVMAQKGPAAMVGTTVVLSAGVCLMELPCTAGFPVVWSNLVAAQGVGRLQFLALLALYMLMYLLDELAVFLAAVVTLRASRLQEHHGRALKLVGGSLMVAFSGGLLAKPDLMNNLSGTFLVSVAAIVAALAAALIRGGINRRRQMPS